MKTNETIIRAKGSPCRFTRSNGNSGKRDVEMEADVEAQRPQSSRKRTRKVRPYPIQTLEEALRIPATIQEAHAGLPFDRVLLAAAVGTTAASSGFTLKLNSSVKYGLTRGGYNDDQIGITPLGEAIVAPKGTEELNAALIESAVQPEVFGRFYRMLAGKRLPEDTYTRNMLQKEFGIQPELSAECLSIIKTNGLFAGILHDVEGALYVDIPEAQRPVSGQDKPKAEGPVDDLADAGQVVEPDSASSQGGRILIGYGGDGETVRYVQEFLDQFGIAYGTAEIGPADQWPITVQVSEEMRACSAAILVFTGGQELEHKLDTEAKEAMLVLAGAASVLYGEQFVLLIDANTSLPKSFGPLPAIEFDPTRPEQAGLGLLREFNARHALKITA